MLLWGAHAWPDPFCSNVPSHIYIPRCAAVMSLSLLFTITIIITPISWVQCTMMLKLTPTRKNLVYGHVQQSTPHTQGNIAYGHMQFYKQFIL